MTRCWKRRWRDYLPDTTAAERAALARLSGGSIGAALTLATGDGGALARKPTG